MSNSYSFGCMIKFKRNFKLKAVNREDDSCMACEAPFVAGEFGDSN